MFIDWNGNGEVDYEDIGLSLAILDSEEDDDDEESSNKGDDNERW